MPKLPKEEQGYSEREVKVILEDIHGQFRVFGEGLQQVNGRLDRMEGDIQELKSDVSVLKSDVSVLKSDVSMIKMALRSVATKDDLIIIDRRLTVLETR